MSSLLKALEGATDEWMRVFVRGGGVRKLISIVDEIDDGVRKVWRVVDLACCKISYFR